MEVENNNPLVTVIVPLYNAEKYITETIKCVIEQTYTNWELIIIDDCSTDTSRDVVKEFENRDDRIKLIESETNFGGPARPRNIGIENAKGEYIAFLDADDVWLKDKLKIQINILESNSDYDIVDANAYTIDEESNQLGILKIKKVFNILKNFIKMENILILSNYININTVVMRNNKEIYFKEDKNLIAIEDWMFWIENIKHNKKIYICNEYLINYRIVNSSISNRSSDIGYRKIFYMYSLLFLNKKISFSLFVFSNIFNTIKLTIKRISN